jgi:hypothetical protein
VSLALLLVAGCSLRRRHEAGWLLIAPPNINRDGIVRREEDTPLWKWERLGRFTDEAECRRFREARILDAPSDETWATWSLARCATADRARGGRLRPDE